jgi:vacuolar protein sorting-associated protein 13D
VVVPPKKVGGIMLSDMNVWMSNFCICIIDDCMDIDVPLIDIQFSRFSLSNGCKESNSSMADGGPVRLFSPGAQGSAEFALNIDYYNRLLSGWEPLVEPWLARLNWKLKASKNVFTMTSMDVLNVNITNPFIELIISMQYSKLNEN